MPKKISINQMREWLAAYEKGESEASIAKNSRRDVRTVKRGIEQARRERNAQTAGADLLKEALRNHHNTLLNTLKEIKEDIRIPPLDDVASFKPDLPVNWPEERRTLFELLQEHLKRDPLWDALEKWWKSLTGHQQARAELQRKAETLLQEKTGLKLSDEPIEGPFIYSSTTPYIIYRQTLRWALGAGGDKDIEDKLNTTPDGQVRYDAGTILAEAPSMEEKCKRGIIDAFNELQNSPARERVVVTYREAETQAKNAKKYVEEISLLGLVPGTCRICRRLGM